MLGFKFVIYLTVFTPILLFPLITALLLLVSFLPSAPHIIHSHIHTYIHKSFMYTYKVLCISKCVGSTNERKYAICLYESGLLCFLCWSLVADNTTSELHCVYTNIMFSFISVSLDGCLGWFHNLTVVSSAEANTNVQMSMMYVKLCWNPMPLQSQRLSQRK